MTGPPVPGGGWSRSLESRGVVQAPIRAGICFVAGDPNSTPRFPIEMPRLTTQVPYCVRSDGPCWRSDPRVNSGRPLVSCHLTAPPGIEKPLHGSPSHQSSCSIARHPMFTGAFWSPWSCTSFPSFRRRFEYVDCDNFIIAVQAHNADSHCIPALDRDLMNKRSHDLPLLTQKHHFVRGVNGM